MSKVYSLAALAAIISLLLASAALAAPGAHKGNPSHSPTPRVHAAAHGGMAKATATHLKGSGAAGGSMTAGKHSGTAARTRVRAHAKATTGNGKGYSGKGKGGKGHRKHRRHRHHHSDNGVRNHGKGNGKGKGNAKH